jgi:Family of unknown function (DUF5947)
MTPVGAFERVVRRATAGVATTQMRCDMCSAPVGGGFDGHDHLLDVERSEVLCACRPCLLLFDREAASRGRYRPVPRRRVRVGSLEPRLLGVPVGLAYFVVRGDCEVWAHYPSPVGATQWEIDPESWQAATQGTPELVTLRPEVEALLVDTARGAKQRWIVPIDDCFRLVAIVRDEWHGLSGGSTVWPAIDRFFEELAKEESADG